MLELSGELGFLEEPALFPAAGLLVLDFRVDLLEAFFMDSFWIVVRVRGDAARDQAPTEDGGAKIITCQNKTCDDLTPEDLGR